MASEGPGADGVRHVGTGHGDYAQETRFRYVGPGPEPGAADKGKGCGSGSGRGASCFGAKTPCTGSSKAKDQQLAMSRAEPGDGEYVQEVAFKYVGKGAGEFALVSEPPPAEGCDGCVNQIIPCSLNYAEIRDQVGNTHMLRLAAVIIVLLLALIITWALWPVPPADGPSSSSTPAPAAEHDSRRQCLAEAIKAAQGEGTLLEKHRLFSASLDHTSWERFGFLLTSKQGALLVAGVEGGLLGDWNDDHPDKQVVQGDHIVAVNDFSGSTPKMLQEFNKPEVIRLKVLRANCGDAPVQSTPTTSTTPAAEAEPYDCQQGQSKWKEGWSDRKKRYCCARVECKDPDAPFECHHGFSKWKTGWSVPKKKFCCDTQKIACEDATTVAGSIAMECPDSAPWIEEGPAREGLEGAWRDTIGQITSTSANEIDVDFSVGRRLSSELSELPELPAPGAPPRRLLDSVIVSYKISVPDDSSVSVGSVLSAMDDAQKADVQHKLHYHMSRRGDVPAELKDQEGAIVLVDMGRAMLGEDWHCYKFTADERAMLRNWDTDEEEICTGHSTDVFRYRYNHGGNDDGQTPGCGGCSCCRQRREAGRPLHEVSLLFSKEQLMVTELRSQSVVDDNVDVITVDSGNQGHRAEALLRFGEIVGRGAAQIRPGALVKEAFLRLHIVDPGSGIQAHRMLVPWDTATTYAELGGDGVTLGTDAEIKAVARVKNVREGEVSLDLKDAVQAWVDGDQNYGIALMPRDSDGVGFSSPQSAKPPTLEVKVMQEAPAHTETSTATATTTWTTTRPTTAPTTPSPAQQPDEPTPAATSTAPEDTTTTQALPTATLQGTGLRAEFFYKVDHEQRSFAEATAGREPDKVATVPDLDIAHGSGRWGAAAAEEEPFAAKWSGQLIIDRPGYYSFELNTDDISALAIDGHVLLGEGGAGLGLSPLVLSSHMMGQDLSEGPHHISVTMLHSSQHTLLAINCRYQGPDTNGEMVSVPQANLRPADTNTDIVSFAAAPAPAAAAAAAAVGQPPAPGVRLQRKFASVQGLGDLAAGRAVSLGAGLLLAAGAIVALLPSVQLAVNPLRQAWRSRAQRRQLRRYESLTSLVETGTWA